MTQRTDTFDKHNTIASRLADSDTCDHRLREAKQDAADAKWSLLYALIEQDPQLAAAVCSVSKSKLRRALRRLLKDDSI